MRDHQTSVLPLDQDRIREHTSLTGAVDAQLAVKRNASDDITLEVEWMKDGPEGDVVHSRLQAVEVGTDDHRHPITSCVVVPADGPFISKTTKPARITKAAQTALRALVEAVSECGDIPPASNHIPALSLSISGASARTAWASALPQRTEPSSRPSNAHQSI